MNMAKSRALFLDRDGVINHDDGYTSRPGNFQFIDGIFDVCLAAKKLGYLLIVVTNQAGIGRGYYSSEDFLALTVWMRDQFTAEGASLTDVFYCPYHPEHGVGQYKMDSFDRKPNPGMLLRAKEIYSLDMAQSMMIGDKDSDLQAAYRAGVGTRCHYLAGAVKQAIYGAATHQIHALKEGISLLGKCAAKSDQV